MTTQVEGTILAVYPPKPGKKNWAIKLSDGNIYGGWAPVDPNAVEHLNVKFNVQVNGDFRNIKGPLVVQEVAVAPPAAPAGSTSQPPVTKDADAYQRGMKWQSARHAAGTVMVALLEKDLLPLPAANSKTAKQNASDAYFDLLSTWTQRLFLEQEDIIANGIQPELPEEM